MDCCWMLQCSHIGWLSTSPCFPDELTILSYVIYDLVKHRSRTSRRRERERKICLTYCQPSLSNTNEVTRIYEETVAFLVLSRISLWFFYRAIQRTNKNREKKEKNRPNIHISFGYCLLLMFPNSTSFNVDLVRLLWTIVY